MKMQILEIFGFIPVRSEIIAPRYFELSLVETITPSIKFCDKLGVVCNICFVDSTSNSSIGISFFENFVLPYPAIPIFFNYYHQMCLLTNQMMIQLHLLD